LPKMWWLAGYLAPLAGIIIYAMASRRAELAFVPPASWMMAGRNKFAVIGLFAAVVLTIPMMKLPRRRDRNAVIVLMIAVVLGVSVWPIVAPAFNRGRMSGLATKIDDDGICRQSTEYTCGPAAAVTALRKLGFKAEEGEIAILAHTSAVNGTPPDELADALRQRYESEGLTCEYRAFKNAGELPADAITLAVIKFNWLCDHYVAVLRVNDQTVEVGDPLMGITRLMRADFEQQWRHVGVVVRKK